MNSHSFFIVRIYLKNIIMEPEGMSEKKFSYEKRNEELNK
jgi:hypothetical protein